MRTNEHLNAVFPDDDAEIVDTKARKRNWMAGVAMLGVALIAGYLVISPTGSKPKDQRSTDEEFRTGNFKPASFSFDQAPAKVEPEIVKLPEPKKVEEKATQFDVPPPPIVAVSRPAPSPAAEVKKEEEFPTRFRSQMIEYDSSDSRSPAAGGLTGGAGAGSGSGLTVAGDDRNSKYLANASAMGDRSAKATKIARLDAVIPEATLIPGILETAISSDLPGQIRAITSEDVYSFDGRRVLIPTGTRLIGEYQSDVTTGQTRIFVVWSRLIRNDGVSIRLGSIGTDSIGRSGLTGNVDNHWVDRFGSAIMLSIVGAGTSYATGSGSSDSESDGAETARQTIATTFSQMANQTLSKTIAIPPTINVKQGERIHIFVRQDLDFSAFYDDPVTEAMREISREHRSQ
ncbi:TrbI/VirB10 family protein [Agrobacterium vitis]|uniref:type IV secretion system protein VirB10 n=1 Tax=Allorhizobium ampelinum TaxID=3025782 RepID=UPI001F256C16|nr:type IV secretion system protein VirB10 [Allorhizobium ampelinum]MCF1450526.1 TrbI/VirB10 family protein [Allorhizobium ampelinum]